MALRDDVTRLRDGRSLAYAEWGDPNGVPLFLFPGSPASRLFSPDEAVTKSAGVRLVTVDRPGYGDSDFRPDRTVLDWPDDVAELADALGFDRFATVGHSSGGPYVLACAVKLSSRLSAAGLVSSVAPLDEVPGAYAALGEDERRLVELARQDTPQAMRSITEGAQWLLEKPELFLEAPRPEPDKALLANPRVSAMFLGSLRESVRAGLDGYACDEVLERRPWGFRLRDVEAEIHLWHGDQDPYIPRAHAEYLASRLPRCRPAFFPDEAHGLIISRWEEILDALRSQA